ncbi:MAG TPA: nitrate reductase [Planctomycetaceae bacterium]|nr:nitrate reductase [Planctomycetaceae bacterium]
MSAATTKTLWETARQLLHQREGVLTRELLLQPSRFGIGHLPSHLQPDAVVSSTCGFCSTGCGLNVHMRNGEAIGLSPSGKYPVNLGMACPKGWEALTVLDSPERGTVPLQRSSTGDMVPTDWPTAIQSFVDGVRRVQSQHGPESFAFLGTGQMPMEELAFFGLLAKFGLGMLHGDANTRQCMATSAVAYKQSFGFDAPPFSYVDFELSDTLIFIGANPCIAHPILWERVMRNTQDRTIVVIDPRRTETAMQADVHLAIQPKGDLALLYGVAKLLIEQGAVNREFVDAHTNGFEEFSSFVQDYSLERVAKLTGLSGDAIQSLADTIRCGKAVSMWWTMGVNQSYQGVRTAQAIINLCLMTGNIGRPGTGPNSITGQCNAMGSRLFGNTSSLVGGRDFANADHRRDVAHILNIDEARIPTQPSLAYPEILEGVRAGKIKGLWIVATNPAHSWINQSDFNELCKNLDFLVVQDMYAQTETAVQADLFLPAAAWGEKEGTFINSERRVSVVRKVKRAPGQSLADFKIFRLIADAAGCGDMFRDWTSPAAAFCVLQRLSARRPCDITGIDGYAMLDRCGGVQWPHPAGASEPEQERRLFADGQFFTPDRRAKFLFDPAREMPEQCDEAYPFILMTGRGSVAQWHTETRTRQSAVLKKLAPTGLPLEIHPLDAAAKGIRANTTVQVSSRRGQITATAFLTETVGRGRVFLPMHDPRVNQLTNPVFDPYSRQPSYKDCAVSIHPADRAPRSDNS